MSMDTEWKKVKDFHEQFGHPTSEVPIILDQERVLKRYGWMQEELEEFKASDNLVDQVDSMLDLIYFALGSLVEMGVMPQPVFDIVHKANMSKRGQDGRLFYNAEGKTLKPEGWLDPHAAIEAEVAKQADNVR